MMHVSATNASACATTQGSSPTTLVQTNILALVTGLRLSDKSRSAAVSPAKDEPFSVLIAETHVAIQDRICRNGACGELALMQLDTPSLYSQIRKAVDIHTRHSLHLARDTEENLRILHPGIKFENKGPVCEWEKIWAKTGWATTDGKSLLPRTIGPVKGNWVLRNTTPVAWNTPLALRIVYHWKRMRVQPGNIGPDRYLGPARQRPPVANPTTTVVYCDGGYDPADQGGGQCAGFGVSIVRGGDGEEDKQAIEFESLSGPVSLDKSSPTFLGALQHTNNTGELTGITEAIMWLLHVDPDTDRDVLLRPDSEYVMGAAIGDTTPERNKDMVLFLQNAYAQLLEQRNGKVKWSHVRSHTNHKWNDRADLLATKGAKLHLSQSQAPGDRWNTVRLDGPLSPHRTTKACKGTLTWTVTKETEGIRVTISAKPDGRITWRIPSGHPPDIAPHLDPFQVDEPARVLRSTDAFGVRVPVPTLE